MRLQTVTNQIMGNKFAIFILTYGRPERVYTYNTLRKQGYSGNIYLITDDSDKTIDQYKQKYKNQVIVFNKEKYLNLLIMIMIDI